MFWSAILPFQITVVLWAVIIIAVTYYAPKLGRKRVSTAWLSIALAFLMFIPSCMVIQTVAAPFRSGVFHYDSFAQLNDWRVERYLPEFATDITLEKPAHTNGFRAKFVIPKTALEEWFDESWEQGKGYSVFDRKEAQEISASPKFSELGWPELPDAEQYVGPCESDGGGYIIWYSETEGIAYEDAGYW